MKRILKLSMQGLHEEEFDLPYDYEILHVGTQGDSVCIWALVNSENRNSKIKLKIFGTGHEIDDEAEDLSHLGTVQLDGFVWHVFLSEEKR